MKKAMLDIIYSVYHTYKGYILIIPLGKGFYMVRLIPFIGRESEKEYLLNLLKSLEIPTRRLLFVSGPSGIGKSRLVQETIEHINTKSEKYLALYITLSKSYNDTNSALKDIATQLDNFIKTHKRSEKLKSIVSRLKLDVYTPVPFLKFTVSSLKENGPITVFNDLLDKTSEIIAGAGGGLVFIDELQNFLKLTNGWSPWGLFKHLSSIQEYSSRGLVRFILVSSDYMFRKQILEAVPGGNIATLYVGELSRDQALALLMECIEGVTRVDTDKVDMDSIIDVIGGSPSNIISYAAYIREKGSLISALETMLNYIVEDFYTKYTLIGRKFGSEVLDSIKTILQEVVERPIPVIELLSRFDTRVLEAIDWLVSQNILQYGNSRYIGIYRWNNGRETGGEGGLDVVAPSSRLYLYPLCRLVEDRHRVSVCRLHDRLGLLD